MIICLSGFVIAGTSPTSGPISARNDIGVVERLGVSVGGCERMVGVGGCERMVGVGVGVGAGAGGCERITGVGARYSPHHHQLLQHFGAGRSSSSSAESVSSHSASPPPRGPTGAGAARCTRVRTLYACLGESEGELSFEPNQIITNVAASGEPGWLRGTLNGKTGLVPENYVEPLP